MSIQKFPLEALKKIRRYIQDTISLRDAERQPQAWAALEGSDELPEPESLDDLSGVFTFGGVSVEEVPSLSLRKSWFVSTVNPGAALLKLPGLWLKTDFRLISYLYRLDEDGKGLVFAVPEELSTTAYLEKALQQSDGIGCPPKPDGALSHFMEAIDGDRSPTSFVIASMLWRELQEFGAIKKQRNWSHHHLIDAIPPQVKCQWRVESPPKDLHPKAKVLPDGQAAVEFYTYRLGKPIVVYRHLDQYPANQYRSNSLEKAIALIQH